MSTRWQIAYKGEWPKNKPTQRDAARYAVPIPVTPKVESRRTDSASPAEGRRAAVSGRADCQFPD